jgi:hypothetical protein
VPIVGPLIGAIIAPLVYDFGIRDTLLARPQPTEPPIEPLEEEPSERVPADRTSVDRRR